MNASSSGRATVARQPIFDFDSQVVAYELLYREVGGQSFPENVDPAVATARVLDSALFDIGLDALVGDRPVYVNIPESMLLGPALLPLSPLRVVVEILETVADGPAAREVIAKLRRLGYRIALDDFIGSQRDWSLLPLADIVKVDVPAVPDAALPAMVAELKRQGRSTLAEKVETPAQLARCRALGFDTFQGYVLQRPEAYSARSLPANQQLTLQLVVKLHDPDCSVEQIEQLVAHDPALSLKILRRINSSYYNLTRRVDSLRSAIIALGLDELRRLCAVVAMSGFNDRPDYVLTNALVRARMCEQLAEAAGEHDTGRCFLIGLMSSLDVLLGVPLEQAVESFPLDGVVKEALLHGHGTGGAALACVRAYETGGDRATGFGNLDALQIARANLHAIQWAESSRHV
jgi:c-di-GMP phosphodiesterase